VLIEILASRGVVKEKRTRVRGVCVIAAICFSTTPAASSSIDKATELVASKPPRILVRNSCQYADQNSSYGYLELFAAIPVTQSITVNGEVKSSAFKTQLILYSLHCGMNKGASVNSAYVCDGAYLELDPLVRGEPLVSGLGPITSSWNKLEFSVTERAGPLFRLSSFVDDASVRSAGGIQTVKAVIEVDLLRGKVTYLKQEHSGGKNWDEKNWEEKGEADCLSTGWTSTGPAKPH
jgi:hypothetical protein